MFERIADGIDSPSEFHKRMAQQRGPGGPRRPEPPRGPTPSGRPGGPGNVNPERIIRAIGNPVGEMFVKILSGRGEQALRLEKRQREELHKLARGCGQRVRHTHQQVIQAIQKMDPKQRAANAEKIVGGARREMCRLVGEGRKHIFAILKPEQHKIAGRIIGMPGSTAAKRSGCCGKCPKSQAAAKGRKPSGCSGKCGEKCPKCRTAKNTNPSKCSGKCGGRCPRCRAAKNTNPSKCSGKCGGRCPRCRAAKNTNPSKCSGKCGGRCPRCRAAKSTKPSRCGGKCGGKCPGCRAGSKGNPGAKSIEGPKPATPKSNSTDRPAPTAAPSGCGGCGSRSGNGIVMSDQGNCKTSDF
ncbi:MAG: hypothetical protein QGG42_03990 [Phycisphaerae bacterium]|nr:hypothetical protein [Phycisphaerae bacterium]